ncbi:MAG: hypothetical protein JXA69_05805 [Phycisphaerae bacterium]|nr:hypothetical protein [Phycisphaerae bacterium]
MARGAGEAEGFVTLVEQDWLQQAAAWRAVTAAQCVAAQAVDGVCDASSEARTAAQPGAWWQVDLGRPMAVERIVVHGGPETLAFFICDDGYDWLGCAASPISAVAAEAPVRAFRLGPAGVRTRFVRVQLAGPPAELRLAEVEIYGPDAPVRNLAAVRPATQSGVAEIPTAIAASFPVERCVRQGRRLAEDLRDAGVDTEAALRALDSVAVAWGSLAMDASEDARRAVYFEARRVVRALALANPLLDFDELLFVKRFTQETYPDICLNHMPWVSRPGGDICRLSMASVRAGTPVVRTVLNGALGPGHVHGMELWWDADRVVFGYAKARNNEPVEGWIDRRTNYHLRRTEEPVHIFEVNVDGTGLRQITDGEWSDLDPTYAPNGDIVFVSERCGCSLQCNEYDKDETSCNLFVCRPDGSNIRWMSVSKDGDYLPHALADGTIGYTRWEYQERGWANIQSIWTIRPDGTGADTLFKQHVNNPWGLEDARSIPGVPEHRLVAVAAGHHTLASGPVVIVTPSVGMNDTGAIRIVTPGVWPPEGGMSGVPVDEGGVLDQGGFYMHPWPLSERCFLAAYAYGASHNPPTGYALYLIDVFGTKELIYRDPAISSFRPMPLRPRPRPPVLPDMTDRSQTHAVCSVTSVTHGADGIAPAQARYLRIAQRLQWPYDNTLGGQRYGEKAHLNNWTPARVLGEVPVEPDGSAYFTVPADTPVYFQLLDENHMELRRMRAFISFQPGERRSCVGCHETRAEAPPVGRMASALRREPSVPVPPPWGERAVSFLRDIQPIFDRHCMQCHTGLTPAAGLDFSGGLTAHEHPCAPPEGVAGYGANRAFDTLMARGLVAWSPVQGDAAISMPLAFGSHRSKLVHAVRAHANGKQVQLSDEEWLRLVTWIDANAPYHDSFVNKRPAELPYDLARDAELVQAITAVHAKRCGGCHAAPDVSRVDWIDIHQPERSLFLTAPLAKAAGGTEACGAAVYASADDEDYARVLERVRTAVEQAWALPRRDLAGFRDRGVDGEAHVQAEGRSQKAEADKEWVAR